MSPRLSSPCVVLPLIGMVAVQASAQEPSQHGAGGIWSKPLGEVVFEYVRSNSETRGIPPNHGGLPIDASINPLLQNRVGRELVRGDNLAVETVHEAGYGSNWSLHLRNRFQVSRGEGAVSDFERVTIRELYATGRWGNVRLSVGRESLFMGQGVRAGILLSHNARALDQVRIESAGRFRLPGILRGAGTHALLLFGADLGPNQNFPHARLIGFRWSWRPVESIHLAVNTAVQMGGDGSPGYGVLDVVNNTIPLSHVLLNRQTDVGNKMGGFEFRVTLPGTAAEIYGEGVWDDIRAFSDFHEAFTEVSGYLIGAEFTTGFFGNPGAVNVEAHRLFPIFYSNTQHSTGWALDGFLLGDNLGPDAVGLQAWAHQDLSGDSRLSLSLAFEIRRADVYDGANDIVKIVDLPDERRIRGVASLRRFLPGSDRLAVDLELGLEHVSHFAFAADDSRVNYLTRIAISLQP